MVKYKFLFSCFLLNLMVSTIVYSQQIIYGSNKGKFVEIDGRNVYYEEYGSGETVLMLHGGPGSIADFTKLIPVLSKNYRVIAMDTPGHGHSDRFDNLNYQFLADNASKFIDKLEISKCYVVGWSDGATTGLLLASKRPDVISKVFASGGFSSINGFKDKDKEFWLTLTTEVVEQTWGGWHLEYQKIYPNNNWKVLIKDIKKMMGSSETFITFEQLMGINSEVLLVWGDEDLATLEHISYLYKTIPNSELMILPGTGHSTFEQQPDIISIAVQKFFKK